MSKSIKLTKFVALIIVLALVCISLASCGNSTSDKETYKVGTETAFPPFEMVGDDGDIEGFDIDLMEAIADDQGFEVEWEIMDFSGIIVAIESSNIDMGIAGMYASDERKKEVDFSDTYYDSGLMLAVKTENTTINGIDDLTSDMKVAAQVGTSSQEVVKAWKEEGKIADAMFYEKTSDAIQDLKNGTVEAFLNDKPVTQSYINKNNGDVKMVGELLDAEQYGIAIKKGNTELVEKVNKGLKNLKENGKFDELLEKWNLK